MSLCVSLSLCPRVSLSVSLSLHVAAPPPPPPLSLWFSLCAYVLHIWWSVQVAEPGLGDFVVGAWLRAPELPVFVLRWGAHYSCVWRERGRERSERARLWHYNGAAGARRFCSVTVEDEEASLEPEVTSHHIGPHPQPVAQAAELQPSECEAHSEPEPEPGALRGKTMVNAA